MFFVYNNEPSWSSKFDPMPKVSNEKKEAVSQPVVQSTSIEKTQDAYKTAANRIRNKWVRTVTNVLNDVRVIQNIQDK